MRMTHSVQPKWPSYGNTCGQLEHVVWQLVHSGCVFQMPYFQVALLIKRCIIKTWKIHLFSLVLIRVLGKRERRENRDIFLKFFLIWPNQKIKVLFAFYTIFHLFLWVKVFLFPGELSRGDWKWWAQQEAPLMHVPFDSFPWRTCWLPVDCFALGVPCALVSCPPPVPLALCLCLPVVVERNLPSPKWNLVFT